MDYIPVYEGEDDGGSVVKVSPGRLQRTGVRSELVERRARLRPHPGVDMVLIPEIYGFDQVSVLGYVAATTERIGLMTGIVNVYSRSPAVLAMAARREQGHHRAGCRRDRLQ